MILKKLVRQIFEFLLVSADIHIFVKFWPFLTLFFSENLEYLRIRAKIRKSDRPIFSKSCLEPIFKISDQNSKKCRTETERFGKG